MYLVSHGLAECGESAGYLVGHGPTVCPEFNLYHEPWTDRVLRN
jgi:hypothetical protein